MKSNKMSLSLDVWIFLIIYVVVILFIVSFLIMPKRITGMYTGALNIVNRNDIKTMETYEKYKTRYAIKVQEKDKYFLETYGGKYSGKYTIDKDKFDSIQEGTYYWFYIKLSKPGDESSGNIKNVYAYNPLQ